MRGWDARSTTIRHSENGVIGIELECKQGRHGFRRLIESGLDDKKERKVKKKLAKIAAVAGLAVVSTAAFAATKGCCGSIECCLRMLGCC